MDMSTLTVPFWGRARFDPNVNFMKVIKDAPKNTPKTYLITLDNVRG